MLKHSILILIIFFSLTGFGQNRKAQVLLEKANSAFDAQNFKQAEELYIKCLVENPNQPEILIKLGKMASTNRQETKAIRYYTEAINKSSNEEEVKEAYQYVAVRELKNGEYRKALDKFLILKKYTSNATYFYNTLEKYIAECEFALKEKAMSDSIKYERLPSVINAKIKQYFPVLTADNQQLYFTAVEPNGDENIYISEKKGEVWLAPKLLNSPINSVENEGTCTISADGRTMVFTSCNGRQSVGGCDLYISYKTGNDWSEPLNLGLSVNSKYWDSQPALSADGNILFFSSDRPNGIGKRDIWVSQRSKNNEWSMAINVGRTINTTNDEVSPFLHANGKTLFFSSNGHKGLGGFDLYYSELKNGYLSAPQNLGYPINTNKDQVSIYITSDGSNAFYAIDDNAKVEIYSFSVPEKLKENYKKTNVLKGKITDYSTQDVLKAKLQLVDLNTQKAVSTTYSDEKTGEYLLVIPHGSSYALHISKEGYLFNSQTFDVKLENKTSALEINVSLYPIRKEVDITLNNIFFDSGKFDLREESFFELNKVVEILENNPELSVEFKGHTDDVGNEKDNLLLSQKRVEAVKAYLISKNIEAKRLEAKGYGETMPIVINDSEEHRQMNRRIEMRIK